MLDAVICGLRLILPAKFIDETLAIVMLAVFGLSPNLAQAGGGPLGIDHEWTYDNHGIWSTRYEQGLECRRAS